jgi:putative hemolysin
VQIGIKDGDATPTTHYPQNRKLIDLKALMSTGFSRRLYKPILTAVESILAINKINATYQSIPKGMDAKRFCRAGLSALDVDYAVTAHEISHIPEKGPLLMVANHPFGGIEGIILSELLLHTRPDVRILGNYLLDHIPELRPNIIAVDPFNPKKAAVANARALKQAMDWVADGGALLAFPSGEVSHFNLRSKTVVDPPWSPHIGKIAIKAKAKVIPVHIHGRNTLFFNLMGMIHPRLRTVLLPRQMINKAGATIQLTIGEPILWRKLVDFDTPHEATNFLRLGTDLLKHRKSQKTKWSPIPLPCTQKRHYQQPIVAPVPKDQLKQEIDALPEESQLVCQKKFRVYLTTADRSPAIMREIGRLRETSFRDVDEGTGRSLDIDCYDKHYLQLFLWNSKTHEIVGAYRIGKTEEILQRLGREGLYSTTLFNYKNEFYNHLDNTLELGRSFIRTEYQKKFGCLAMLWRGIGEFVARNCRYRYLFGPVSISQNYHKISKNLMVAFFSHNTMDPHLAPMVKPRKRVKIQKTINRSAPIVLPGKNAIEEISMLVSKIEKDNKGVPTLIKHYLKLNGQFLAFNLDKAFANVIDGLVWVDLLKTNPKLIERFLTPAGTKSFYAYHNPDTVTQAA